jgi:hypothetical protein
MRRSPVLIIVAVVIFVVGVALAIPLLRKSEAKYGSTDIVNGQAYLHGPRGCTGCLASVLLIIALLVPAVLIVISVRHH